jgi:O-acetyl-ADP-ribose deacetylase (regulator of RNase III)
MSGIRLWNGDICDLQVDAIVVPSTPMLWMTSGAAVGVKQRGGHGIEFEAVAKAPQPIGSAVATGAGTLACRYVIHAVSLGPDRRTSAVGIDGATRAALRMAESLQAHVLALPSLGSQLGGVPLAECARIMTRAIHETVAECPSLDEVVLALRGSLTYAAFQAELGRQRVLRAVPVVPGANGGPEDILAALGAVAEAGPETQGAADRAGPPSDRQPASPGRIAIDPAVGTTARSGKPDR